VVRFALCDCSDKAPVDGWQIRTAFGVIGIHAADEVVLLIGHDPRTGAAAMEPRCRVAVVGGFHCAVVVVAAVDFGVAVVEAAAIVEVQAVNYPVLAFGLIIDCGALGVVLAQSHAGGDEDSVGLVAHYGDRRHVGDGEIVESTHGGAAEPAARSLREVIVLRRLVVDLGYPAMGVGTEFVLRAGVGIAAWVGSCRLHDSDVERLQIGLPEDLIQRSVVSGVECAGRAMCRNAGITGSGVDVTWTFGAR